MTFFWILVGLFVVHTALSPWMRRRRARRFDPERLRAEAAEHIAMAEAVRETFGAAAPTEDEQLRRLRDGWPELETRFQSKNVSPDAIEKFKRQVFAAD